MNEFRNFLKIALGAIALLLTIAASVGAINYGLEHDTPYIAAGVCNLLCCGGLIVYGFCKYLKKNRS